MAVLWINGEEMPTPSELTVTKEPVWSRNAGRGSTGLFIGDIVCHKFKLQIKWAVMSQQESAQLNAAVTENNFFEVKFIDPTDKNGTLTTKIMYAATPTYPVYSYVNGYPRYVGIAINLIEQ